MSDRSQGGEANRKGISNIIIVRFSGMPSMLVSGLLSTSFECRKT